MQKESLYHINDAPFLFAASPTSVKVRLRAKRGDVKESVVLYSDRYVPPGKEISTTMSKIATTEHHDYYEAEIRHSSKRLRYVFLLTGIDGSQVWYGERSCSEQRLSAGYFHVPYVDGLETQDPPAWAEDAIAYQIFPERFHNGDPTNDPEGVEKWTSETKPTGESFYGGDLKGILLKLPYLRDLGINTVYFTPIFASSSNHKYNITDYYRIDPAFGDKALLKELVQQAHKLGIRVMLDAVFNHSGDQFFAFQDVLKNGEASPYKDWYHIHGFPVRQYPTPNYETFANNIGSMPKLNTRNDEAREYFLRVAEYWIKETDIDGWRLDVANEVDHDFWREFRRRVKKVKPDALIIGEIMHSSGPWLRGDQFDGVMNYLLRDAMLDFFAYQTASADQFACQLAHIQMQYTDPANKSMFNLFGSHDTERFLTACGKTVWGQNGQKYEVHRLKLATFFLLTYTGIPMIYYGDEVGMSGGEDPDCRRPMIWQEHKQNGELLAFFKQLISLRHTHFALRKGSYRHWFTGQAENCLGYLRQAGGKLVGCVLNNSPNEVDLKVNLPDNDEIGKADDLLSGQSYPIGDDQAIVLHLEPYGMALLHFESYHIERGKGSDAEVHRDSHEFIEA